jgi:hypothetical protein
MSRWQMERVVDALENTSCFYVWIDRLSVPQYECELQNTLLSRMMATYASARETLVLRSIEENGSRYHQRAWCVGLLHRHFRPTCLLIPAFQSIQHAGALLGESAIDLLTRSTFAIFSR